MFSLAAQNAAAPSGMVIILLYAAIFAGFYEASEEGAEKSTGDDSRLGGRRYSAYHKRILRCDH